MPVTGPAERLRRQRPMAALLRSDRARVAVVFAALKDTWSAEPADVQEVAVWPRLVGIHVDKNDGRPRRKQPALDQLQRQAIDLPLGRDERQTPHDIASEPATAGSGVAARIVASGRHAESSRAVCPSTVTATIASAWPVVASATAACASAWPWRVLADPIAGGGFDGRQDRLGVADDRVQRLHDADGKRARGGLARPA